MSDSTTIKYRLVGAAVVILSSVLAWWLLLDHDVKRSNSWDGNMPEPMVVERFDIDAPRRPDIDAVEVKSNQVTTVDVTKTSADQAKSKKADANSGNGSSEKTVKTNATSNNVQKPLKQAHSKLDAENLPEAWVLQIASFQEKANAEKLKDKLLADKFAAYIKAFDLPDGRSYRVLVGPEISKDRAKVLSRQIEKSQGLKSIITRYKSGFRE